MECLLWIHNVISSSIFNWPNSQIPECTCSISHNAPFRQKCAHFCSEWRIVGYGTGAFWDLWNCSIIMLYVISCYKRPCSNEVPLYIKYLFLIFSNFELNIKGRAFSGCLFLNTNPCITNLDRCLNPSSVLLSTGILASWYLEDACLIILELWAQW